jgi:hypothetical protein
MKPFLRNNGLSLALFGIFAGSLISMSLVGWHAANNENRDHNKPTESYIEYIGSGDFIEGVFENWESEFLQMWALVVLTIWLRQKGADESKPLRGSIPQETSSRYSISAAESWEVRRRAIGHAVYSHSLGLALIAMFLLSFLMHAAGGAAKFNEEAETHGQSEHVSTISYIGTSQFWYESFQNWQSEFFAVGMLMVLSIKLRERGSPESKPVGSSYDHKTGS